MSFRVTVQSAQPIAQSLLQAHLSNTCGADFTPNEPFSDQSAPRVLQAISARTPSRAEIEAASANGIDLGAIPAHWRWQDLGLLASDMDSTLITCECIDEIADFAGIKPRVAEITERAMRGELDFAQALRERVALLKGLPESVLAKVYEERVRLTPGAEALVRAANVQGAQTLLVSGGFTYFTEALQRRLNLTKTHANLLGVADGKLTGTVDGGIIDGHAKANAVRAAKATLAPGKLTIAMGDGANDLPMMAIADLSVAYRAKPAVRAQAMICLNHCGLDAVRALFPR